MATKRVDPVQLETQYPQAGDAVRLAAPWSWGMIEIGTIGIIDGTVGEPLTKDCGITFRYSCYRGCRYGSSVEYVSCSGGPATAATPVGELRATYDIARVRCWRWKDGISGAGNGEDYTIAVRVWDWFPTPVEPIPADQGSARPTPISAKTYFGVEIPQQLPFFDCRIQNHVPSPTDARDRLLLTGCDRAAYALGLRTDDGRSHDIAPIGVQLPSDTRIWCYAYPTAGALKRFFERVAEYQREFDQHIGIKYRPRAVVLDNFGISLLCDERDSHGT